MDKIEKEIMNWWNYAADYYQEEISKYKMDDVYYGPFGSNESKLNLLGSVKNKRILEIGCGGGQVSIALSKMGAECTAIDISEKEIKYARKNAAKEGVNVKFEMVPFSMIYKLPKNGFDIAISVMSLQYSKDLKKLFMDVNKLLKKRGILVFSIEHPLFLLINPKNMRITDSYISEGIRKDKERRKNLYYVYFHRKISTIINFLIESKFSIEKVVEPMEEDKIWGLGYRKAIVNKIGPTIIFKAVKGG